VDCDTHQKVFLRHFVASGKADVHHFLCRALAQVAIHEVIESVSKIAMKNAMRLQSITATGYGLG
jgi:hypothetical protein